MMTCCNFAYTFCVPCSGHGHSHGGHGGDDGHAHGGHDEHEEDHDRLELGTSKVRRVFWLPYTPTIPYACACCFIMGLPTATATAPV